MARRRRNISVAVSPLMAWLQRFAVFLLILVAVGMLVWNRMDARFGSNARMLVADVMSPLLNVFSQSSASVTQVTERFRTYEELANENDQLKDRIRILEAKAQTLDELLADPIQDGGGRAVELDSRAGKWTRHWRDQADDGFCRRRPLATLFPVRADQSGP